MNPRFSSFEFKIVYVEHTPEETRCPVCKTLCKRHSKGERTLVDIDLDHPVIIHACVGIYRCPNGCNGKGGFFRIDLPFAKKGAHYSNRAQDKCIVSKGEDKMPFDSIVHRVKRDFHISPVKSTIHRWFNQRAEEIDITTDYEPWAVASFSGVVCIDELYDQEFVLLFATDPISGKTISYQLTKGCTKEEVKDFLEHLKKIGIDPEVIITDGSNLYPDNIASVFERAKHQLCIFHVERELIKILKQAIKAYKDSLPKPPRQKRGRPKKEGRPIKKITEREKIHQNRRLLFMKPENLTEDQEERLSELLANHPPLKEIRDFTLGVYSLFEKDQEKDDAWKKWKTLTTDEGYLQNEHLKKAIDKLPKEKFASMITFLDYENLDRTNNNVERANRRFRKDQKSCYRIRTSKGIKNALNYELIRQRHLKESYSCAKIKKLKPRQGNNTLERVA